MSQTAYPASFGQQRLWFLDQLEPGTAAYNIARAFRITGPLDIHVLTRAFETMVERHESLRTVFDSVDGEARQIVLSDIEVQIPVVDLTEIWRELLAVDRVGVDQNFFELGGHSLVVLQMIARIARIFEVELPVRSVFEEPTIEGLAVELEKAQALGLKAPTPIVPRHAASATTGASREAILSQLDNLSAAELQSLLNTMLDGKQPA